MNKIAPTVVIVPGLREHVPGHWQTLLAERLEKVRTVPPLKHGKLSRAARVAALDTVVNDIDGPVILVAHSAGVITTVHWAQQYTRPILAALLATPADLELPLPEGYPAIEDLDRNGWNPIPRRRLSFPSIVAVSSNDPLARHQRVTGMAEAWGSRTAELGPVGHLNPIAGYGYWPQAEELLQDLLGRSTEGLAAEATIAGRHAVVTTEKL